MTPESTPRGVLIPLLVIATAQLMLVLDDSIVNIALPSIQTEFAVDPVHLPWVVNAYIVAFGALLLLGGRVGDVWGRRRTLQIGIAVFVLASLVGGLAQGTEVLVAARAAQGIGAAMAAPNALALIATTFADRRTRDSALSLYGAMSGLGIVVGLLLGGVLTGTLGWRWVFFINIPIGLIVLLGSRTLATPDRQGGRLGFLDAVWGTAGMLALVYAITRFGENGFGDPVAYALVAGAGVLLTFFVLTQRASHTPLVPLSLFRDRNRVGAYLTMLGLAIGPMGAFYVITLYLQQVLEYSPLRTGLSWLPFAAGLVVGAGAAPKLLAQLAPRVVAAAGALIAAGSVLWFSSISTTTGYWLHLAPAMILLGLGFGLGAITLTQAAVSHVNADKAGIASALLNSAQQIGVALGLAILAGVAAGVTAQTQEVGGEALVTGYGAALLVGAVILAASAVVAAMALDKTPWHVDEPAVSALSQS